MFRGFDSAQPNIVQYTTIPTARLRIDSKKGHLAL